MFRLIGCLFICFGSLKFFPIWGCTNDYSPEVGLLSFKITESSFCYLPRRLPLGGLKLLRLCVWADDDCSCGADGSFSLVMECVIELCPCIVMLLRLLLKWRWWLFSNILRFLLFYLSRILSFSLLVSSINDSRPRVLLIQLFRLHG